MKYSWESAAALQTYFGILRLTKNLSGTPLNLNFWRTTLSCLGLGQRGACQFFATFFTFTESDSNKICEKAKN